MSEERPHYHAAVVPDTDWDETASTRFDGVIGYQAGKRYPAAPYEVVDTSHLELIGRTLQVPDSVPPLDPQQPTPDVCRDCGATVMDEILPHYHDGIGGCSVCCPICRDERVAAAATAALSDIEAVIRLWPHPQFGLDGLLVLYRTLLDNPPT